MDRIEHKLKNLMLKDIEIYLDGKCIKRGKVKLFNTKQFFIKFKLDNGGDVKEYELPYPYRIDECMDGFMFDYCLSAFCPPTELAFYKMKLIDKSEASKIYDNHLYIIAT